MEWCQLAESHGLLWGNTKRAITNSIRRDAFNRWEYSTRVWNSIGGISWPWQSGQSGHPKPDSLDLTYPPNATWLNAEISVMIDSSLRLLLEVNSGEDFLSNKVGYLFRSIARLTISTLCAFFHLLTVAYRFWVVKETHLNNNLINTFLLRWP